MKPRLCLITSVVESLSVLLRGQPRFLADHFDITLITSPSPQLDALRDREGVDVVPCEMPRRITPRADLVTLRRLARYLRHIAPDLVQTYTPKAGLLGMLAAGRARVPHRVHGIVGMPLMEASGARRRILGLTERTTYAAATHLICNSLQLRDWVRTHLTDRPVTVIGDGSINGIDTERWRPDPDPAQRRRTRHTLGLDPSHLLFVFVGRLVRDKGAAELVAAFDQVRRVHPEARLLLVGHEEPRLDPLPPVTTARIAAGDGIVTPGFVADVQPLLAASDVFVLPSYREGLPNSLLEAGAVGLPAITTDINGCNEVVIDSQTGILVPPKDPGALAAAMRHLASDPTLRATMGRAARHSVVDRYDQTRFWRRLLAYYQELLDGGR